MSYDYDPDKDPLIQRARSRGPKSHRWLWIVIAALVLWIGYREFGGTKVVKEAEEALGADSTEEVQVVAEGSGTPAAGVYKRGWSDGKQAEYGLSADIKGKGSPDLAGTNGLRMAIDTDLAVNVEQDHDDGGVELRVEFDDVSLNGNMFGNPVNLQRRNGVTQSLAPTDIVPAETALNKKFKPPTAEAFEKPSYFRIAPDGNLSDEHTDGDLNHLVDALLELSGTNFPKGDIQIGETWDNEFELHLPGMNMSVPVIVEATLEGETQYSGYNCGVITQRVTPGETHGPIAKIAHVAVTGDVQTYFGHEIGRIVASEANLVFDLKLIGGLQEAADLLGVYSGLLDDLEGGQDYDLSSGLDQDENKEPIGVRVHSWLALK